MRNVIQPAILYATLFALLFVTGESQACSSSDITLSSQAQINSFAVDYPACTSPGSLRVEEVTVGEITSLAGLIGVQSVVGNFQIFNNTHLESLQGLQNLSSVGGNLDLYNNHRLRSLDGLDNLTAVGGFLDVSFSDYLIDIDALAGVDSVGTHLRLFHLYGLHDCRGVAPYIETLAPASQTSQVLIGTEGGLPRNGTGANSVEACINSAALGTSAPALRGSRPNILFFLMDDIGIDQLGTFGNGGAVPPVTPAIDDIAQAGVMFNNVWAMPECSPTRVALFTGQLPLISGTTGALGTSDLANSQLSPYTETLVDKLKTVGYRSAMVGKWHLGGPEYNAAELTAPIEAGFDYYWGNVQGFLRSIDSTAGGIAPVGTYSCGFVPSTVDDATNGADTGACYTDKNTCQAISLGGGVDTPGRSCLEQGGIFVPGGVCAANAPANLDFAQENAYYVGKLESMSAPSTTGDPIVVSEFTARGYRTTLEADEAIRWVQAQSGSLDPWFMTLSFSAAHTPLQQVPQGLLAVDATPSGLDCTLPVQQRVLQKGIISAISHEIGRVLIETGLMAATGSGGELELTPAAADTIIIIAGDNGSLGPMVDLPFDPTRAKGTVYQTGVQVPLIIAGAGVGDVGVTRAHQLSLIDVYGLILDAAGLPLATSNPPFDPVSPIPLLERAQQSGPRGGIAVNVEPNLQIGGAFNPPCEISGGCTVVPISKSVCEDNSGTWYGPGADGQTPANNPIPSSGFATCWEANEFLYDQGEATMSIPPTIGYAAANETHKLVRTFWLDYDPLTEGPVELETLELFQITDADGNPQIDYEAVNLLAGALATTPTVQLAFEELSALLEAYIEAGTFAPEDGNRDGVVDQEDVDNARSISSSWGKSSRYDVNLDGTTDTLDLELIWRAIEAATGIPAPIPALPLGAVILTGITLLLVRARHGRS